MTIRDELLAIQEASEDRVLHASAAVAWAEAHPASALARALEWDDAKAAREHRLWQVRQLIKLHIVDERGEPAIVSLSIDRKAGGGYRDVADVMSMPKLRDVMLRDALAELERVQRRYDSVKELAEVWAAMNRVKAKARRQPAERQAVA